MKALAETVGPYLVIATVALIAGAMYGTNRMHHFLLRRSQARITMLENGRAQGNAVCAIEMAGAESMHRWLFGKEK